MINPKRKSRNGDTLEELRWQATRIEHWLSLSQRQYLEAKASSDRAESTFREFQRQYHNIETRMKIWHEECDPEYQKRHYGKVL